MAEQQNVGRLDSVIRIILGIACLAAMVYYFVAEDAFAWYLLIPLVVLVPFFLKTGATRVCPVMKAMGVSTMPKASAGSDDGA